MMMAIVPVPGRRVCADPFGDRRFADLAPELQACGWAVFARHDFHHACLPSCHSAATLHLLHLNASAQRPCLSPAYACHLPVYINMPPHLTSLHCRPRRPGARRPRRPLPAVPCARRRTSEALAALPPGWARDQASLQQDCSGAAGTACSEPQSWRLLRSPHPAFKLQPLMQQALPCMLSTFLAPRLLATTSRVLHPPPFSLCTKLQRHCVCCYTCCVAL